jgi:hypothetical protein
MLISGEIIFQPRNTLKTPLPTAYNTIIIPGPGLVK